MQKYIFIQKIAANRVDFLIHRVLLFYHHILAIKKTIH